MKLVNYDNKYFLYKQINNIHMVTTTANSEFGIHPRLPKYSEYMSFIKETFGLDHIFTLSQTHSSIVNDCTLGFVNRTEGDGLVTADINVAIGVFTADCVPIFMFDKNKQVISSVHSGWKGTYNEIVLNSLEKFIHKYGCNPKDIEIYIGPHNKKCCYEVGEDLREKFWNHERFNGNEKIFNGNNLDLSECIKASILYKDVPEENINVTKYCTYCSEDVKFYSYRKDPESLNRLFSFIFIK